jgi:hypothetical protein
MGGQSALTTRTAGCPSALALVWHHSETQQPQSGTTASCSTCTIKDYPTSYALHEGRQRPDPARPKMGPLKQRVQTHLRHLLTGDLTTGRTGVAGDRTGTHVPRRTQAGRTGLARGTELHSVRHWLRSIAPQDINGVAIADLKITKAGDRSISVPTGSAAVNHWQLPTNLIAPTLGIVYPLALNQFLSAGYEATFTSTTIAARGRMVRYGLWSMN